MMILVLVGKVVLAAWLFFVVILLAEAWIFRGGKF